MSLKNAIANRAQVGVMGQTIEFISNEIHSLEIRTHHPNILPQNLVK